MVHQRLAFDVFTAATSQLMQVKAIHKRHKYDVSVRAAGDQFCNVPFTPPGTPYLTAMDFLQKIWHSGNTLPAQAGRDAPRFVHEPHTQTTGPCSLRLAEIIHLTAEIVRRLAFMTELCSLREDSSEFF